MWYTSFFTTYNITTHLVYYIITPTFMYNLYMLFNLFTWIYLGYFFEIFMIWKIRRPPFPMDRWHCKVKGFGDDDDDFQFCVFSCAKILKLTCICVLNSQISLYFGVNLESWRLTCLASRRGLLISNWIDSYLGFLKSSQHKNYAR